MMKLVLDYGCAETSMSAIRRIKGWVPVGVDLGPRDDKPMAIYDGRRLPFRDGTFDVIVSQAVIEHVRDLDAYCSEAARVLKKGGRMFAEFPTRLMPFDSHGHGWLRHWLGNRKAGVFLRWPWDIRRVISRYFQIGNITRRRLRLSGKRGPSFCYHQSWVLAHHG
jgi:SAM-dependent methyltransferase